MVWIVYFRLLPGIQCQHTSNRVSTHKLRSEWIYKTVWDTTKVSDRGISYFVLNNNFNRIGHLGILYITIRI